MVVNVLVKATRDGDVERVKSLLEGGWLRKRADADSADQFGRTPLCWAAIKGHVKLVKILLDAGANKDATDTDGMTPLCQAAERGHTEVMRMLLDAGANMDAGDKGGMTPLHWVTKNRKSELAVMLLEAGANTEAATKDGMTALYWVAKSGWSELVRLLLDAGANKEASTTWGLRPLHASAGSGHKEVVSQLLYAGADTTAADKDGGTPLHWAVSIGHKEVVRVLLDAGANKEAADKGGRTALHVAAFKGHKQVARILLDAGANKEATDNAGRTALAIAREEDHDDVIIMLATYNAQPASLMGSGQHQLDGSAWQAAALKPPLLRSVASDPAAAAPPPRAVRLEATSKSLPESPSVFQAHSSVTLSTSHFPQASVVSSELAKAGFKAVLDVVAGVITTNPVHLVSAIVGLVRAADSDRQAVLYCQERVQRVCGRVDAMVPALETLHSQLQIAADVVDEPVLKALSGTLIQLAQVVVQLRQLLQELATTRRGALQTALRVLKAQGYKEVLDLLDSELRACMGQLTTVLSISQFTSMVVSEWDHQETLQVAEWQDQNAEDRRKDMVQLEELMLQAVGGVQGLEARLATQEGVLDGQRVQLQQVADWLQGMQASSAVITAHLVALHEKVDNVKQGVDVIDGKMDSVQLGVNALGARMDSLGQAVLEQVQQFMVMHDGAAVRDQQHQPSKQMPAMVIARSSISLPDDARSNGRSGAFGTVVQGYRDGGEVAVKIFNYNLVGEMQQEDAVEEAWLLHKANHHNVVRCFGVVHDPDTGERDSIHGSLVMEWVGGGTLQQWLQRVAHRNLGFEQRLQLALQVAAGMKHLHELRIVHGDLKPQNILVQPQVGQQLPQVKICDFGLAKYGSSSMTTSQQTASWKKTAYTRDYTSPQRLVDYGRSRQDDVYAFGILLHFIATSRDPWEGLRAEEVVHAVKEGVRPKLQNGLERVLRREGHQRVELVAGEYCRLAERCWAADEAARPGFEEVYQQLNGLVGLLA